MAYLGPYPTSRQSPQMRLLPHNSLHRHSSIVTMASLDPAPASQPSLQALNFLKLTSPGPAHASLQPLQAQLLHLGGPSRPSLCLPSASTVPTSASQQILHAQHLPHCGPPQAKLPTFQQLLHTQLLPPSGLFKPSSCFTGAFPGPTFVSWQPSLARFLPVSQQPRQAQVLPHTGLSTSSLCLTVASPGPTPVPGRHLWAQNLLKSDSLVPTTASWWAMKAQNLLKLTSPGPAPASCQCLQAQPLPHGGFSRPTSSSWLSLQAQLLPRNSLFWPSSCPAHGGQCRPKTSSSQTLQTHLLLPGSMNRPSFDLRTASAGPALVSQGLFPGPALASWQLPQAKFLPACQQPQQAQLLPHNGPFRPNS
uniref:DUF4705 domain-containing protein n=1 Tax=Pan troglodytes TaxID=9598 RepID=A0A2I3SAQ4_PANTR